jgi:hypothetical protein
MTISTPTNRNITYDIREHVRGLEKTNSAAAQIKHQICNCHNQFKKQSRTEAIKAEILPGAIIRSSYKKLFPYDQPLMAFDRLTIRVSIDCNAVRIDKIMS